MPLAFKSPAVQIAATPVGVWNVFRFTMPSAGDRVVFTVVDSHPAHLHPTLAFVVAGSFRRTIRVAGQPDDVSVVSAGWSNRLSGAFEPGEGEFEALEDNCLYVQVKLQAPRDADGVQTSYPVASRVAVGGSVVLSQGSLAVVVSGALSIGQNAVSLGAIVFAQNSDVEFSGAGEIEVFVP